MDLKKSRLTLGIETVMEFKCERCRGSFTCKRNLLCHLQKQFKCCPTQADAPTAEELYTKWTTKHVNEINYPCRYCGEKFNSKSAMYKHHKRCSVLRSQQVAHVESIQDGEALQNSSSHSPNKTNAVQCEYSHQDNNEQIMMLRQEVYKLHNDIEHRFTTYKNELMHLEQRNNKLLYENEQLKSQLLVLQAKKNEEFYQNILEKHFKATHKKLPIGITDITTEDTHIEFKRWNCWREAFAQLILYNSHDPKEKLHACFFGEYTQSAKNLAIQSLKQQNITCFELMQTDDTIYMVNLDDNNKEIVYTFDTTPIE